MNTPVAMMVFNRPEVTEKVFAAVAAARPPVLLLVADGPRADRPTDAARVDAVRAIVERVDWPCRVLHNYADANMGVRSRPASGLAWVFEQVEEAIIVEDDTLPDPSFFSFCEELLTTYRHDERIGHINGFSAQDAAVSHPHSYYFSTDFFVWGWASWRRAFRHYDPDMHRWPEMRHLWRDVGRYNGRTAGEMERIFEDVYRLRSPCWDFPWIFTCWAQNYLSISPYTSLIENIGFGAQATGVLFGGAFERVRAGRVEVPLAHPPYVQRDPRAERVTQEKLRLPLPLRAFGRLSPGGRAFLRESARRFLPS